MIVKLVFLVLIVWLGLHIYQTLQRNKQKKVSSYKAEDMVSCDSCGIHIPVNEALKNGDKYYCCTEHLTNQP